MIDKALSFILSELNGHLAANFPSLEPHAVMSTLSLPDGSAPEEIDNKIVLTVANVGRETAAFAPQIPQSVHGGQRTSLSTPLNLNVYLLVSGSFRRNYIEALRLLSSALSFLHVKSVFTPQNSAGFPTDLERLTSELVNLSMADLQNLWACQGAKYLPSALFKLRMISIQDQQITGREPVISGSDARM